MAATHASRACCELPPVQVRGYSAQGRYSDWNGTPTYVTGPESATKAIFYIYDVFGYTSQTLQGADMLAKAGNYLVVIPGLLGNNVAKQEWFVASPDEESQKMRDAFMSSLTFREGDIKSLFNTAGTTFPSVSKWGAIGYCWGGKIAVLCSAADTPWSVAIQSSPARVDPNDAARLTIPFATLASKSEPTDKVKAFEEAQKTPKLVQTFDGIHGFMSARADLEDPVSTKLYEQGYKVAANWFAEYL